jgi:hypothetical protein
MLPNLLEYIDNKGKIWVTSYKGTSKHSTEINRDSINEFGLALDLKGVAIISIDEDWSALRFKKLE